MDLTNYLQHKRNIINSRLNALVPLTSAPNNILFEAARYSVNSPGKRLRPILTLATVEMLQGDEELAVTPACAIEMIHTYSMIHDDLPCMDDDDFRRGKPTLHKAFPEGIAVLAGDFLLTHAFQVISETQGLIDSQRLGLISVLATNAGGEGMIGGQIMDLEAEGKEVSFEALEMIHQKKTGALISASVEFGAIIANASAEVRELLKQYGDKIGLAFQIIDDILDVTQSQTMKGKEISSDVENNKSTYVTHLGVEKAKEAAFDLIMDANQQLDRLSIDASVLREIADYTIARKI